MADKVSLIEVNVITRCPLRSRLCHSLRLTLISFNVSHNTNLVLVLWDFYSRVECYGVNVFFICGIFVLKVIDYLLRIDLNNSHFVSNIKKILGMATIHLTMLRYF